MPPSGQEVFLTELEIELLAPFVARKILDDRHIAVLLMQLADKLEGKRNDESN